MTDDNLKRVLAKELRDTFISALDGSIELLESRNMPGAVDVIKQFKIRMLATFRKRDLEVNGRK